MRVYSKLPGREPTVVRTGLTMAEAWALADRWAASLSTQIAAGLVVGAEFEPEK